MTAQVVDARPLPLDAEAVERLSRQHGEPDWLLELRRSSLARALDTPMPTGLEEEWRRTSLKELPRDGELLAEAEFRPELPDDRLAERGVVFTDLSTAAREHPDLLRRYLGRTEPVASHAAFWALSLAGWTGGTFLYVPRGLEIDGTLIARITQPRSDVTFLPHTLVVADEGSSVTLLEETVSPDGAAGWFGGTVAIHALPGSRIRYANLQRLGDEVWNIGSQRVEVGQDAVVTTLNTEVGSRVTKLGLDVQMTGKGGTSLILGLLAAGNDQHIDINSLQDLWGEHTTSDLLYLSALYERARAAFYGVTRVQESARQSSSYQECRNLLLSPNAGAEPIPILEIKTNDLLRCGHGATAGAIDPIQRFYAESRGLNPDEAERMIVRGFFEQVIAKISVEPVRTAMLAALAERIGHAEAFDDSAMSAA
ncbi:MAG TPA: SufD family Fe-S cluster assembly protein [Candidatus Limnocylindria bacterium]|nr:SufD family Fe-S cluster assembly protein [Candidatus Limnocylindria bacterium]